MATSLCARKILKGLPSCPRCLTPFFPIVLVPLLSQLKRFNFDCIRFVFSPSLSLSSLLSFSILLLPALFAQLFDKFAGLFRPEAREREWERGGGRGRKEGVRGLLFPVLAILCSQRISYFRVWHKSSLDLCTVFGLSKLFFFFSYSWGGWGISFCLDWI